MAPQWYEGPEDEVEDTEIEAPVDETEEAEEVEEEVPANPLDGLDLTPEFADWLKGKDPKAVQKTFDKFTQEWEGVLSEKEQLAPLAQLKKALEEDPRLVKVIEDYYENGEGAEEAEKAEIAAVKQRLERMEVETRVKKEFADLTVEVNESGLPAVDETAVLEHAAKNGFPSLRAAYRDLHFDAIREGERDKALEDVRKQKQAKVETRPKAPPAPKKTTLRDIEDMSDDEFLEYMAAKRKK